MTQRVIKFRAWDNVLKFMVPNFDNWIDFDGNYWTKPEITSDSKGTEIVRAHNYTIMQFTGLLDKHGKEIYEGDIRKEMFDGIFNGDPQREHYFVMVYIQEWTMFAWLSINSGEYHEYLNDGAEALDTEMYWTYPAGQDEPNKIELVGNIYTNPELVDPKMIER